MQQGLVEFARTNLRRVGALGQVVLARRGLNTNLAERVAYWARRRPNDNALWFEGRTWTYREVHRLVDRRAAALSAWGLRAEDTVALMMDNRPEFVFDALALYRLGVVAALVNTKLTGSSLRHALDVARPSAAIIGGEHLETFREALGDAKPGFERLVDWEEGEGVGLREGETDYRQLVARSAASKVPRHRPRSDDLCALIYTSGTTGLPKAGKVLNARVSLAAVGFGALALAMRRHDVFYNCLPMFHSNGFIIAMGSALYNGATLALARKFSARGFWHDVRESRATTFVYIGEVCRYLLNHPPSAADGDHRLRCIVGNGLRPEIWSTFENRFKPGRIHEFYAATEGNVNMVNLTGRVGSVGKLPRPVDNALLVRFDPDSEMPRRDEQGRCIPCRPGEVGELLGEINPKLISQRFDGYADATATRRKILHDVLKPGDAWFRSGDLLEQDADGYYYFVDRIGDTFRWKGENVSTNEVAGAVQTFPRVAIANVYGVAIGEREGRAGMVTLLLEEDASFEATAFYRHVRSTLPEFARPAFVRHATRVALTATFKLRKVELVAEGFDPARVDDPLFYRDDATETYRPLGSEEHAKILEGTIRF